MDYVLLLKLISLSTPELPNLPSQKLFSTFLNMQKIGKNGLVNVKLNPGSTYYYHFIFSFWTRNKKNFVETFSPSTLKRNKIQRNDNQEKFIVLIIRSINNIKIIENSYFFRFSFTIVIPCCKCKLILQNYSYNINSHFRITSWELHTFFL